MEKGEEEKYDELFPETWEENLSLYKLVETPAVELLRIVSEAYLNSKSKGLKPKIPSILLISKERGLGAETFARCFANSIGNSLTIGIAETLAYYDIRAFFVEAPGDTTYYIVNGERLNLFNQAVIYKLITDQILDVPDRWVRKLNPVHFDNSSIIISTLNAERITLPLLKALKVHIQLMPFSNEQIVHMLLMKNSFYRISATDESLEYLSRKADGNAGKAERLWFMSAQIMKSEGQECLHMSHIRRASQLTADQYP